MFDPDTQQFDKLSAGTKCNRFCYATCSHDVKQRYTGVRAACSGLFSVYLQYVVFTVVGGKVTVIYIFNSCKMASEMFYVNTVSKSRG